MSKVYLELNQKDGRFFEYSKDPKEGFEKFTSSTGKESYRRTLDQGAIGRLKYINEVEDDFGKGKVKSAQLVLETANKDWLYLKVPVTTVKGSLNEYFEQLATFLPALKVGEAYRIFPYSMETEYTNRDGVVKPTVNKGFSIKTYDLEADTELVKVERHHRYDDDIPKVVWEKEEDIGGIKNVKNDKERKLFLYNSFKSTITPYEKGIPAAAEQPKPKAQEPAFKEEDHDDLPF